MENVHSIKRLELFTQLQKFSFMKIVFVYQQSRSLATLVEQ